MADIGNDGAFDKNIVVLDGNHHGHAFLRGLGIINRIDCQQGRLFDKQHALVRREGGNRMELFRVFNNAGQAHETVPFTDAAALGTGSRSLEAVQNIAVAVQVRQQGLYRLVLDGALIGGRGTLSHDIARQQQLGDFGHRQRAAIFQQQFHRTAIRRDHRLPFQQDITRLEFSQVPVRAARVGGA